MFDDLRGLLEKLDEMGQLLVVEGADWDLEIGTINELTAERKGPALLFDKIKGYPPGFRVASNLLYQKETQILSFGLPGDGSDLDRVKYWKDKYFNFEPVPPVEVKEGPILENVLTGDDIDMFKFPTPKWHMLDGGRYIGTGVISITRDPEEGWVNFGTYRVMIHEKDQVGYYISPSKHGAIHRKKYWDRGEEAPVCMVFGQDPLLFGLSTMAIPSGVSEYDMAGYIRGKGVEVIIDDVTGLPIPATAEIVVSGFAPPPSVEGREEGPFGEWTGYYASGARNEPVVHVKKLYHRNDPIIFGQPPVKPPVNTWFPIPLHTAPVVWNQLDKLAIPGIKGVYIHGMGGRIFCVISLEQMFVGHAKQVATLAAGILQGGACTGRFIITVDDDIDPSDFDEVLWAVTTRMDPETQMHVVPGYLTSPLEPWLSPEKRAAKDFTAAKVLMNACRPFHWQDRFAPVNVASPELRQEILEKYKDIFNSIK